MASNLPLKVLIIGTLAMLAVTAAAQYVYFGGDDLTITPLEQLSAADIPGEILVWIDTNKTSAGYGAFYSEGRLFLAARMGERPTGGYRVLLGDPGLENSEAIVAVEFIAPKPWDFVTQAITYPWAVAEIAIDRSPATALFVDTDGSVLSRVKVVELGCP